MPPKTVKVHEAKTHFSALIADVERGEEVVIARGDKPVAKLVGIESQSSDKRKLGYDEGLPFWIADDFDEFLPEEWREYTE